MSQSSFELKGSLFTLSVLKLNGSDLNQLDTELQAKVAQAPQFFECAPIVVDLIEQQDAKLDFELLKSLLTKHHFVPVGICNGSSAQKQAAKSAGLAVLSHSARQEAKVVAEKAQPKVEQETTATPAPVTVPPSKTMVINHPVRSGQQIYAKGADLVVLGQVGHGAEVIADGSIHIYGTLRGRAIAGAQGDTDARIFCQSLQPELVSICGRYWLSDSLQEKRWQQSGVIRLEQDNLLVDPLQ